MATKAKAAVRPQTLGEQVIQFCEMLRVPEGAHGGRPLKLRPWQRQLLIDCFDDPDLRRIIISFARKNGKTALAAMILLATVIGPLARLNSQIYSAAQSRDQAGIVFGLACKMYQMTPELAGLCVIRESKKEIFCPSTGVLYRALSADATTAYGYSPRMTIHDELGQVIGPVSELYDALETASGAQDAPLSIIISTQARSDSDLLSLLIDDGLSGRDPTTKVFLWTTDESLDLQDEDGWQASNPALGDFLNATEFAALAQRAKAMPSFEPAFRNLNLNQRVASDGHFLSPSVWKLNGAMPDESAFEEFDTHIGLDLGARQDLCAAVLSCADDKGDVHVSPYFWTPDGTLSNRAERDKAPYKVWRDMGHLIAVPGVSIDYAYIAQWLIDLSKKCRIASIRFDRWRVDELKRELNRLGYAGDVVAALMVEHGQGFRDMAPAIDRVEQLALQGKLRHGMHPVLTWNVANAVITSDPAGNRKLDKSKRTGRIDGAVALLMAVTGLAGDLNSGGSYIESSPLLFV